MAGDGITNDNTLTLNGTAEAGSVVKVYDGTTLLGSAVVSGTGIWSYTTTPLSNGTHSLTAIDSDAAGNSSAASSALAVTIDPNAPVATDDVASTNKNTAVNVNVLANDTDPDGDALSISGTPTALHGTVIVNSNGTLHYTPNADYTGSDTISYLVTDGSLDAIGHVAMTVSDLQTAVNSVPVANNDVYATGAHSRLTIGGAGVLGNDTDPDGDVLSALLVSKPSHGKLTFNANGTFTYTPDRKFVGVDSFTYKDNDGSAYSGVATVTINVGQSASGKGGGSGNNIFDDSGLAGNTGHAAGDVTHDQTMAPAGADLFGLDALMHSQRNLTDIMHGLDMQNSQAAEGLAFLSAAEHFEQVSPFLNLHHHHDLLLT